MSVTDPLVSVIVPSFQQGRFLRQALASLAQQTYPRLEVIVRDNASTDETVEILAAYRGQLTQVVRERDNGQADALARGFATARGDILGWLNADDMLMPDAIERAVRAFADGPDVVYGHCALLSENGEFSRYFHEIRSFALQELINFTDFIPQPSTFFRRDLYARVGGIDPELCYAMDWDLWCRFAKAGATFRQLDEVLSGWRMHRATKTASGGLRRLAELVQINNRHKTTLLPLAFGTHVYANYVMPRIGVLHAPMRWVWRGLSGRSGAPASLIRGLNLRNELSASTCELTYPLWGPIAVARLRLAGAGGTDCEPLATLNGVSPHSVDRRGRDDLELEWRFDPPRYAAAVNLEITAAQRTNGKPAARVAELAVAAGAIDAPQTRCA